MQQSIYFAIQIHKLCLVTRTLTFLPEQRGEMR